MAAKAAYRLDAATVVGVESYNDLGAGRSFGCWNLNFGVGYGYGRPEDRWILKAVVGVPLS